MGLGGSDMTLADRRDRSLRSGLSGRVRGIIGSDGVPFMEAIVGMLARRDIAHMQEGMDAPMTAGKRFVPTNPGRGGD
ncbi:hypothetical protein DFP92_11437 [Yoonia sediminilitoris]|uniref:Uncharacterized protein n=1 Tax=Yoonia sediminilitoris TaxID=1286148 RepID=A0A2T6K918_9RHOB|nr:hypothetical protein C8N45_11437 [Yoonia sediminilitoris]RCW91081.1 hypothetical protein DFP92_11437 [Yoonia sediminilitoris]